MIGSIRGRVTHRTEESLTLTTSSGVGYEIETVPEALSEVRPGEETIFYTHLHVREDDLRLFGFPDRSRRDFFRHLLPQKGIGPRMALRILADLGVDAFHSAIQRQDVEELKRIKGIGKKTAKRLILEMAESLPELEKAPDSDPRKREAVDALTGLGFTRDEASSAVSTTEEDDPNLPLKELIQKSLARMEPT